MSEFDISNDEEKYSASMTSEETAVSKAADAEDKKEAESEEAKAYDSDEKEVKETVIEQSSDAKSAAPDNTAEQNSTAPVQNASEPDEDPHRTYHTYVYSAEEQRAPGQNTGYAGQPYRQQPVYPNRSGFQQQNGYQQGYNPYSQQTSQGYYRPDTNEYVYSPQPQKKKKGAGKAVIIAIACILSVFVISVGSISAYNFLSAITGNSLRNPFTDNHNNSEQRVTDSHLNEFDDEQIPPETIDNENDSDDTDEDNAVTTPVAIRDFPSLEQLAAPKDAMSTPDIYDKVSPSVVGVSCSVRGGTQTGTGFVISEDGYIVTNAHVIEDYLSVMIVDGDLNEYEAEVIGYDSMTDIAVLKADLEDKEMIPVEFGKSSDLRIGELAIAIGNPLGFDLYGTMSTGIISGLNRTVTIEDNTMNLLQTSATINNGNSGGPLIDAYGRVIGITSAKVDTTYGENLGFAIPIDEALPIVESLIRFGYIPGRPSIGITGQNITELMSFYYRMPKGVYVFAVSEGSGADKAGIRAGDIIIAIQGESITTNDELSEIKNQYKVGDTVTLTIYRGGENFDVDVVLSESTPEAQDISGK